MDKLESSLDGFFVKKVGFKLPDSGKKVLISAFPWLALIGGVLALLGAWSLFSLATLAQNLTDPTFNAGLGFSSFYQYTSVLLWVNFVVLLVEGAMLIGAYWPLRSKKILGWRLVYWVALINLIYTVVYIFINPSFFSTVFSLLATVIGLFLLFQVRGFYLGESASPKKRK